MKGGNETKTAEFWVRSVFRSYIWGEGRRRQLSPRLATLVHLIAIVTTLYNLWAVIGYPEPILHRAVGFSAFFALTFLIYSPPGVGAQRWIPWYDWVLAILSVGVGAYVTIELDRLVQRYAFLDPVTSGDFAVGAICLLLLLEGCRRIIGPWLPVLALLCVAYTAFGQHIPGLFGHNSFSVEDVIDQLFLTTDGVWGAVLGIAVTQIILFIIFGAFLQASGASDFLFDLASAVAGRARGGLAKVSILASGLLGMVSGSPVANVTSVGAVTIPMMKRSGYPKRFAAAVECCASTGGAIMPPVMGSVAFLMAGVIGVPYIDVVMAAVLPAVIYYCALYFAIDFRAGKLGLKGMDPSQIPQLGPTLLKGMVFFIPLVFLIWRLMDGYTPSRVALEATVLTVLMSWARKDTRMGMRQISKALAGGTTGGLLVVVTCATSGIIVGLLNLTGIGTKFSSLLIGLTDVSALVSLLGTMMLALILGLAMNITPSYLLTAVVAGPALIGHGFDPLAAHMFILFFSVMATMTPPVATTAFAAASIAGTGPMAVAWLACRIGLVAFLMPYAFVYQNALLLIGSPMEIAVAAFSGILGVALMAMSFEAWAVGRDLTIVQRLMLGTAGLFAIAGSWQLTAVSLLMASIVLGIVLHAKTSEGSRSTP